jgi:divalent metal cation (Fe/Co/Zn/Cd) transporter
VGGAASLESEARMIRVLVTVAAMLVAFFVGRWTSWPVTLGLIALLLGGLWLSEKR